MAKADIAVKTIARKIPKEPFIVHLLDFAGLANRCPDDLKSHGDLKCAVRHFTGEVAWADWKKWAGAYAGWRVPVHVKAARDAAWLCC
jgi:hypothetical protein